MLRIFLLLMALHAYGLCFAQTGNPFDIGISTSPSEVNIPVMSPSIDSIQARRLKMPLSSDNPFDIGISHRAAVEELSVSQSTQVPSTPSVSPKSSRNKPGDILTLLYSIAMLIVLTLAINVNRKRFMDILKSLINSNYLKNLYKDNRAWTDIQSLLLYGLFFCNAAFLLHILSDQFGLERLPNFLFLLLGVFGVYAVRHFAMLMMCSIYGLAQEVDVHNYSIGIHNMILGVVFVPFILGFGFVRGVADPIWGYLFLACVLIIYALRQIKGILSIITTREFNVFYFFIYLCAVEIAPILISWKIFSGAL